MACTALARSSDFLKCSSSSGSGSQIPAARPRNFAPIFFIALKSSFNVVLLIRLEAVTALDR